MSESSASMRRKIDSAGDLQSVVRTMKAVAASGISQYQQSVLSLTEYTRAVELGLGACLRQSGPWIARARPENAGRDMIGAVVFGSDQGLVGQFNDVVADYAIKTLSALAGEPQIWAVGERVHARLADAGLPLLGLFPVPNSVRAVAALVGRIQIESEAHLARAEAGRFYLFHNRPRSGALYEPVGQRLLPLDQQWRQALIQIPWQAKNLPEILSGGATMLRALIREYLYISLFRACAESLASENASRLAAMERADKNIDELLENLHGQFHRLRQSAIDEELFDVVSGYESLKKEKHIQPQ